MIVAPDIAASNYEGWVAYANGSPIFEAVEKNPYLKPLAPGVAEAIRPRDRTHVEWRDLPHPQLQAIELYAFREVYGIQPIMRIDREPGNEELRFIQMKLGALQFGPGIAGQQRTGVIGYRIGYWNPVRFECDLIELTREHRKQMDPAGEFRPEGSPPLKTHPCWSRPRGFGLGPHTVGLTAEQIPAEPST